MDEGLVRELDEHLDKRWEETVTIELEMKKSQCIELEGLAEEKGHTAVELLRAMLTKLLLDKVTSGLFPQDRWALDQLADMVKRPGETIARVAIMRLLYDRDPKTYYKLAKEYLGSPTGQLEYVAVMNARSGARVDGQDDDESTHWEK